MHGWLTRETEEEKCLVQEEDHVLGYFNAPVKKKGEETDEGGKMYLRSYPWCWGEKQNKTNKNSSLMQTDFALMQIFLATLFFPFC